MLKDKRVAVADPVRGMDRVCSLEPAGCGTKVMPHGSRSQEPPLKTTDIDGDLGGGSGATRMAPDRGANEGRSTFPPEI